MYGVNQKVGHKGKELRDGMRLKGKLRGKVLQNNVEL